MVGADGIEPPTFAL